MPTRMLRDWTDSTTIEQLTAEAERLFVRLIMQADDFGRFSADLRMVRARCLPLLTSVRDTDISRWITECEKAGLIVVYQAKGRSYLAIKSFRQRLRKKESWFPAPDGQASDWLPPDGGCQTVDGQLTVNCQTTDGLEEKRIEGKGRAADAASLPLDEEVQAYIHGHPKISFANCNAKRIQPLKDLVKAVGWDKAKEYVERSIPNANPPFDYAYGIYASELREGKHAPATKKILKEGSWD